MLPLGSVGGAAASGSRCTPRCVSPVDLSVVNAVVSPLNVSEGRRIDSVRLIADAAREFCHLLDVHSDRDHNRSVITLAGEADALCRGVLAAAAEAINRIDLNRQEGVHPRLGAVDVVPFVPADGAEEEASIEHAIRASRSCAGLLWEKLRIPCFLYELSSGAGGQRRRVCLPSIRREAFISRFPDLGEPRPHPTAGAAAVGARSPLVAYNVNLDTTEVEAARTIAAAVRQMPSIRALGFVLRSKGVVQVSCNLTNPAVVSIPDVFDRVVELAARLKIEPLESECVGLIPREALKGRDPSSLRLTRLPKFLEDCLQKLAP